MTPTLVLMKGRDKDVLLAVGSPGGSTIPTTVMQVISNVVDLQLDVSRAVHRGRIHHQWLPDEVWVDQDGLDPSTQRALEAMGHKLKLVPGWGEPQKTVQLLRSQWRTCTKSSLRTAHAGPDGTQNPIPPETSPFAAYTRIFADVDPAAREAALRRLSLRKSALDAAKGELGTLKPKLSADDRRRLEQHETRFAQREDSTGHLAAIRGATFAGGSFIIGRRHRHAKSVARFGRWS